MRVTQGCSKDSENKGKDGSLCKICKKKRKGKHSHRKSKRGVGMENLQCINESLAYHSGYGETWRLVPKDSCDVYKARREKKRQDEGKQPAPGRDRKSRFLKRRGSRSSTPEDSGASDADSRYSREKSVRAQKKPNKKTKTGKIAKKIPRRRGSESTVSSRTTRTETTASTRSRSASASRTVSDMDE